MTKENPFAEVVDDLRVRRIGRREFIKRAIGLGLSAPAISAILAACGQAPAQPAAEEPRPTATTAAPEPTATTAAAEPVAEAEQGGRLRLALASRGEDFDPPFGSSTEAGRMIEQLYSRLVSVDPGGNLVPDLAETWEISDDVTTFTFNLRQNIPYYNYPDGERTVTAKDAAFCIQRLGETWTEIFIAGLQKAEALDEHTVRFTFESPSPQFLTGIAIWWAGIYPPEMIADDPESYDFGETSFSATTELSTNPVGTGPFLLKELVPQDHLILGRNPDYYDPSLPKLDEIFVVAIEDETSRVNQLISGEVDLDIDAPPKFFDQLDRAENIQIVEGPVVSMIVCMLNCSRPPFDKVEVRKAAAFATDRQQIVDLALQGHGDPIFGGPIGPSGVHWAHDEELRTYEERDLDRAKELLEQAGYDGQEIELLVQAGSTLTDAAQILQQQWAEAGLNVNINAIEGGAATGQVFEQFSFDAHVVRWGTLIDPDDFLGQFLYHDLFLNPGMCGGPELDAMLDEGKTIVDREERKEFYHELERFVIEDEVPWVYLYHPSVIAAANEKVKGLVHESALTRVALKEIWLEA